MQAPSSETSPKELPSAIYQRLDERTVTSHARPHTWLNADSRQPEKTVAQSVQAYLPQKVSTHKVSSAITGTVIATAGLAAVALSEWQTISIPVGEGLSFEAPLPKLTNLLGNKDQATYQTALNQATGITPEVPPSHSVNFSDRNELDQTNNATISSTPNSNVLLSQQADGSWSLAYNVISGQNDASTQTLTQSIVSQLAQEAASRREPICLDSTCQSLSYIQSKIPEAQKDVQAIQTQIEAFESKHAQGSLKAYQTVLAERVSEISAQESRIAIELLETQRYISHLKATLSTFGAEPTLVEQLLAADSSYQTSWTNLQQAEAQILAEFSEARIDTAALNRIYNRYEQSQSAALEATQAVLANYLSNASSFSSSLLSANPATLDVLQSLAIATHQQDAQKLRQNTIKSAQSRLQQRHQALASNISKYEALKRELATAQQQVNQYTSRRSQIAQQAASAAPLMAGYGERNQTIDASVQTSQTIQTSDTLALAEALERKLPEGSTGKVVLGIAIAASAAAIALQRRSDNIPKTLSIVPYQHRKLATSQSELEQHQTQRGKVTHTSNTPQSKQPKKPVDPEILEQLLALTQPTKTKSETLALAKTVGDRHTSTSRIKSSPNIEAMSRELDEIIKNATTEARFTSEVLGRRLQNHQLNSNIEPIRLPIEQVDAFAESAVQWVLKDLRTYPTTKQIAKHEVSIGTQR